MDEMIIEQAADWVTRLQGNCLEPQDRKQLTLWLDESVEHRRVFERMATVLERSEVLRSAAPAEVRGRTAAARPIQRWLLPVGALAATLALVGLVFVFTGAGLDYQTVVGERRSVPLEDGSIMHLNAMSSVHVRYDDGRRLVEIDRGEALFEVRSDPARPFVVTTDELIITVLGTTFNVTAYDQSPCVTVVEGKVTVQSSSQRDEPPTELVANEKLALVDHAAGPIQQIDSYEATAWREGWIILKERPLQELVDRLNRQFYGSIEIAEPALSAMKINVVLRLDGREATLRRLQQLLPVTAEPTADDRTLLRARR